MNKQRCKIAISNTMFKRRATYYLGLIITGFVLIFFSLPPVLSQSPTHYPSGGDPVEFNFVNIMIYIVAPVLLVILYLWYRQHLRRKESEKKAGKND